jgi:Zn-dependent oligopeptidase
MERDNLMHGARTALNTNEEMRVWAEEYLKERTRSEKADLSEDDFEKYWKYHKPEIMHEGAAEAIRAYKQRPR